MTIIERDLTGFCPLHTPSPGAEITSFTLLPSIRTPNGLSRFSWKLEFPLPNTYRIICAASGSDSHPRPPHDNAHAPLELCRFRVLSFDQKKCTAVFSFPQRTPQSKKVSGLEGEGLELRLGWTHQIAAEIWQTDGVARPVLRDLRTRSYAVTEHGMMRHWVLDRNRLHLGLGEKAAPIDLTGRRFVLHATDAALYDSYRTDPLYKHTPFLISTPRPAQSGHQGVTYAIFHATNSIATWDVGAEIDYPSGGWSKQYLQDWGGLEEWVMFGRGVQGVVQTYSQIVGKPRLIGRDWLGYLGSTMLLSDKENAQELLEAWPGLCREYDIPCSAMHVCRTPPLTWEPSSPGG